MKKPKRLPFEEFCSIYSKVPRLCVDLAIKSDDGVLLIKRDIEPWKGQWHTPGGTLLLGEKIKNAIARIAFEETGLTVKVERLLGAAEATSGEGAYKHGVSLYYLVTPAKGKLRGSIQGKDLRFFKTAPRGIIKEQKDFLIKQKIINS